MKTRLLMLIALASSAVAQSPGTFSPTGNTATGRCCHTATLLADGRVLIAGEHLENRPGLPVAKDLGELVLLERGVKHEAE